MNQIKTVTQVANSLVSLCREGKVAECIDQFYDEGIISIEPEGFSGIAIAKGVDTVLLKHKRVGEPVKEVHSVVIGEPIIAADHFALTWKVVMTLEGVSEKVTIDEIIVYEVKQGKIVEERFFYKQAYDS